MVQRRSEWVGHRIECCFGLAQRKCVQRTKPFFAHLFCDSEKLYATRRVQFIKRRVDEHEPGQCLLDKHRFIIKQESEKFTSASSVAAKSHDRKNRMVISARNAGGHIEIFCRKISTIVAVFLGTAANSHAASAKISARLAGKHP